VIGFVGAAFLTVSDAVRQAVAEIEAGPQLIDGVA
jgi:hypothetical protein